MLLTTFYTHSRVLEIPKSYLWTRLPYSIFLLLLLFISYIHRRKLEDEPFGTGGNFPIVKHRPNFPLFYHYFVLVLVCLCSFISAAEHQTFTSTMNKFIAIHS